MNIVFFGTADFAVPALKNLVESNDHKVSLVVTNEDKPYGRGKKLKMSQVKEYAIGEGLDVITPKTLKGSEGDDVIARLKEIAPDVIVVAAYGKIIPKEIIDIPKYAIINIHGSMLPEYRGAAPIQRAVLDGKEKTGVTIMYVEETLDTGDIILQEEVTIEDNDTTGTMFRKLAEVGARLLMESLNLIKTGKVDAKSQDDSLATYAEMIKKDEAIIDFNDTSKEISNKVRGLNGSIVAKADFGDKRYKIYEVRILTEDDIKVIEEVNNISFEVIDPGKYVLTKESIYVKTGDGVIEILDLQAPSRNRMNAKEFLKGNVSL